MTSSTHDQVNEERRDSNRDDYRVPMVNSSTNHSTHFVENNEPPHVATPLSNIVSSSFEEQDHRYMKII